MKLKYRPEDFQVEELTSFAPSEGPFALYRLTKRSLGTPEAVDVVLRQWRIPRARLSYGGLKDRHAVTTQFLTIRRGPGKDLKRPDVELVYVGQADRPFTPAEIAGNRFVVVLRDLSRAEADRARKALESVRRDGLPNYFDEQRFGSVGESGEFIARAWCAGDYERALWLALADPHEHDRSQEKKEKRILREHWSDWGRCKSLLSRSHRRSVVTYLVDHPHDFRGAFARVRQDLRSLYLSAFQSFLWNRILAELLRETCRPGQFDNVRIGVDDVPFYRSLSDEQRNDVSETTLPLPSARQRLEKGPLKALSDRVLGDLGLTLRELRIKSPRDSFFSRGTRAAVVFPERLDFHTDRDEHHRGSSKLVLRFDLPRGSYATILVKRAMLDS